MVLIALKGTILALVVNTPLIFYLVWSWRSLRQNARNVAGSRSWLRGVEVWLRLLVTSITISVVWPVVTTILGVLAPVLGYFYFDGNSEEFALAQFFLGVVYLPYTIASWIAGLLPKSLNSSLVWILLASFIVLLMAISVIQWFIIRFHLMLSRPKIS